MAYTSHGETDWDEGPSNKTEFIRLRQGEENTLRVISKPYKFGTHHVKFPDDPNKKNGGGRRVRCAGEKQGCVLCKIAKAQEKDQDYECPDWAENLLVKKMRPRWYIGVLVKDVNPVVAGILEIGSLIRNRLKELFNNKKWGDPRNYDITVKVNPNAQSAMEYYSVDGDPDARGPLDPSLQKIVEGFDFTGLAKRCDPVSSEDVERFVQNYREWVDKAKENTREQPAQPQVQKKTKSKKEVEEDEDDDGDADFNFKNVTET